MKLQKVKNYLLTGSIHTVMIITYKKNLDKEALPEKIKNCIIGKIESNKEKSYIKLNPNKLHGDLFTFSEFQEAMKEITGKDGLNLTSYYFRRVDFRLDNYDPGFYEEYWKLNNCLILVTMVTYKSRNRIKTEDPLTFDKKTIAFKNADFEMEYYNRNIKNKATGNTTEPAKARLEIRMLAHRASFGWTMNDLKDVFTVEAIGRLTKSVKNYESLQKKMNDSLQKKFLEDQKQPKNLRVYYSISDFVTKHRKNFYQTSQLEKFLSRFPELIENPKRRAYKLSTGKIETISKTNLEDIVSKIRKNMKAFFSE